MVLKHFLIQNSTSLNPEYKIEKLVIDDCALSDKSFATILEGLVTHRDHIRQVSYFQNEMGPHSLDALLDIVMHLDTLQISNVNT
jgi:hypothetical protein